MVSVVAPGDKLILDGQVSVIFPGLWSRPWSTCPGLRSTAASC